MISTREWIHIVDPNYIPRDIDGTHYGTLPESLFNYMYSHWRGIMTVYFHPVVNYDYVD